MCLQVSWWRLRSLLDSKKTHGDKHTATFSGERNHAVVTGLRPFSEYSLIVMAFNSRGNGPGSHPVNFKTPEGGEWGEDVEILQLNIINLVLWVINKMEIVGLPKNGIVSGFSCDRSCHSKFEYLEMKMRWKTFDTGEDIFHGRKEVAKIWNKWMNNTALHHICWMKSRTCFFFWVLIPKTVPVLL